MLNFTVSEHDTQSFVIIGKKGKMESVAAVVVYMVANGATEGNRKLWNGRFEMVGGEDAQTARRWAANSMVAATMPRIMEAVAAGSSHGVVVRHVSEIMFGEGGIYGTLTNFRNGTTVLEAQAKDAEKAAAAAAVLKAKVDARAAEIAAALALTAQDGANVAAAQAQQAQQQASDSAAVAAPVEPIAEDVILSEVAAPVEHVPTELEKVTKERDELLSANRTLEEALKVANALLLSADEIIKGLRSDLLEANRLKAEMVSSAQRSQGRATEMERDLAVLVAAKHSAPKARGRKVVNG